MPIEPVTGDRRKPTDRLHRHRGFRRLWTANAVGGLGQEFSALALSVTAVLVLHASTVQVGIISALAFSGHLFIGIPVGVWVDNWQKKRILVAAELIRFVAVLSIPLAFAAGVLSVGQLMLVAAITGLAGVFFDTAHTSILPVLVTRAAVSEASARLQTSDTTVHVLGPGLAGQALRVVAAPVLYLLTAGAHLVSALLLAWMPVTEPAIRKEERDPFGRALRAGLSFVLRHPVLRTFMLTNASINFAAGISTAILPVFVLRDLGMSPQTYGVVISVGSVGGILGSLIGLRVKEWLGEIRTVVAANLVLPFAFVLLPLARVLPVPHVLPVGLSEFLFGLVIVVGVVSSTGVRAKITPQRLMGRVSASSRFVTLGAVALGAVIGGLLATTFGNTPGLYLAVAISVLGAGISVGSRLRRMRDLPTDLAAED
jgi:predicted MFS family arabinose efflux permease